MEPVPWPAAFDEAGWLWQLKWDGVRALAAQDGGGRVRLWGRSGREWTERFPELVAQVGRALGGRAGWLDGEIVALTPGGTPSFPLVLRRVLRAVPSAELLRRVPVVLAVFDVLAWDGGDLRDRPLALRLEHLGRLTPMPNVHPVDSRERDGTGFVAALGAAGLEGAVAKRADSPYVAGRSPLWRKVKPGRRVTAAIAGWREGPAGQLRSLALALPVDGEPTYVGQVGAGLGEAERAALLGTLRRLPPWPPPQPSPAGRPPPALRWVQPRLGAVVRYLEWTPQGRLRAPVFVGFAPWPPPE